MNVLSFGQPFFRNYSVLQHYRGEHDVRSISVEQGAHYCFDPARETLEDVLARLAPEWRPDLILCWFPENDPPPLGIERSPIPTAAMAGDWNMFHSQMEYNLGRYDAVLCDKPGLEVLRNEYVTPHHLMPLYAQDSRFHRPYDVEKDIDILYGGSLNMAHYRERGRFLERVAKLSDRYRVALVDGVFDEAYGRLLARSKIVFNRSIRGELNLRVFETFAAGSLAFLERENQEVGDWFEDGRELVLYGEDDLEDRLAYYLERPEEAREVAQRGHARACEFAPETRLDAIIHWAAEAPRSGRRFVELPPAEQALHTLLMYGTTMRAPYFALKNRLLGEAAQAAPDDPRPWAAGGKALTYPKRERFDTPRGQLALRLYGRAAQLAPQSAPYAFSIANVHAWMGNSAAAEPYLRATIEANSVDGGYFLAGWFDEEIWLRWMRDLSEGKANLDVLRGEAHVRLARLALERGDEAAALEHADSAVALDDLNRGAVELAADLRWKAGQRQRAIDLLLRHRDSFPFELMGRIRLIEMLANVHQSGSTEALQRDLYRIADTLEFSKAFLSRP